MKETWVQSLGWEDPLENGMATHSSILAWRIPWTEEPGKLQFTGSQKVRCDWATFTHTQLPYNVVLVSAIQWSESAACIHIPPPSWTSLPPNPHATPLGHHRAPSWAPCALENFLSVFLNISWNLTGIVSLGSDSSSASWLGFGSETLGKSMEGCDPGVKCPPSLGGQVVLPSVPPGIVILEASKELTREIRIPLLTH